MKKIIHNIRKKSEGARRRILHILVFCFAIILFFLWVYSLGTNLTNKENQAKMSQGLKPISTLKANLIDGYNSLTEPNLGTE